MYVTIHREGLILQSIKKGKLHNMDFILEMVLLMIILINQILGTSKRYNKKDILGEKKKEQKRKGRKQGF